MGMEKLQSLITTEILKIMLTKQVIFFACFRAAHSITKVSGTGVRDELAGAVLVEPVPLICRKSSL